MVWRLESALAAARARQEHRGPDVSERRARALVWLFALAAVVSVPSLREGYGMTAREAMAYGRPVVATRVGGLADLDAGTTFVSPGDAAGLRAAIAGLLADSVARGQLGDEARRSATSFGVDAAARRLKEVYEEALSV